MNAPTLNPRRRTVRHPIRGQSRVEQAQAELEDALDSISELTDELRNQAAVAAAGAREAADSALETAGDAADVAGEKAKELSGNRHVLAIITGAVLAAIAAVVAKKLISSAEPGGVQAPGSAAGPPHTPLNDPAIKQKVESVIFRDSAANKGEVSVTVANGVVELHGKVESDEQARELVDAASALDEVNRVENKLEVASAAASNGKG